jgi:hypothetical protein
MDGRSDICNPVRSSALATVPEITVATVIPAGENLPGADTNLILYFTCVLTTETKCIGCFLHFREIENGYEATCCSND